MNKETSLEEYKKLSEEFNKLSFLGKIKTIMENSDRLVVALSYDLKNDSASWSVRAKDKQIQKQLEDSGVNFEVGEKWGWVEIIYFLEALRIPTVDAKDFLTTGKKESTSEKTEDSEDVVPKYYWPV